MTDVVTSAQFIAPILADDGMVSTRATERQSSCDSPAERYWSEPQACVGYRPLCCLLVYLV
jgi:hypothetical protein